MSRDPVKSAAHGQVRHAIEGGRLTVPSRCSECGNAPGAGKDGRRLLQAHHQDYSKPLDVEWLCAKCHRGHTPMPDKPGAPCLGEANGRALFTADQVQEIRSLSAQGWACKRIARLYERAPSSIRDIIKRRTWNTI